jgi:hypothetical protein
MVPQTGVGHKLFLFSDDIEEFLVVAADRNDAFMVIEEKFGADAADELVMSKLYEYPDSFQFREGLTAGEVVAKGRGIQTWMVLENRCGRIKKPPHGSPA